MTKAAVTLEDKYALKQGRVYLTGSQALVRLPMLQRERDQAAGLNTEGFISGYRGSPLGNFDRELWAAKKFLEASHIHFQPGVNEDLAATSVWGTQQVNLFPDSRVDGVFSIWYGKGPGVDRSGDVFKHGNMAGTAPKGGVLLLAGDDHGAKSSTAVHQSEYSFMDAHVPVLNPAGVQEILDFGVIGWAMSRFSGLWVGMKTIAETLDSSTSAEIDPERVKIIIPDDFPMPPDGLHIRWPDTALDQEMRLMRHKIAAALAFARVNRLDKTMIDSPEARFGIVTTGKSYLDVLQALEDLGIDEEHAAHIGIRLYKVGMSWPLESEGVRHFAEGLEEILVVEEKRSVIESQLKEQLYNWREDVRPRVIGKYDEKGEWILPSAGELNPAQIAKVIAKRIGAFVTSLTIKERLEWLEAKERSLATPLINLKRIPYFCAGCPHNSSTHVPEGSRAMAGIGCHYMVNWMDRSTATFTHMGGEGATWIGQAPFTNTPHVFQNLGDGTYFHSGILAIRAAVSAKVNITYKILFNDAVAMTGGQPIDGPLDVPMLARQVSAEGVGRIAVVSDEPDKYPVPSDFPPGATFHHRDDLDVVQKELREWPGVSALIYDQTCAAEKRRRRKRGKLIDPPDRVFINELICEGCGDCGVQSNCVAIVPVETEFGRKRAIDQSVCNKDYSCLKGFCPSFVTVTGAKPRRRSPIEKDFGDGDLPVPALPALDHPYSIVVTGIGGTGVVTIGALMGMAAHIEGKGCSILDMMGMAQKNGGVVSHIRLAERQESIHAVRIAAGGANLLIGCDMVVAAGAETLSKLRPGRTHAVINAHELMPADFTRKPDLEFPEEKLKASILQAAGEAEFVDATAIASALLGDSIATNLFMLGYAWQKGFVPLSHEALDQAIELNGAAVELNKRAFALGRRAAVDRRSVEELAAPVANRPATHHLSTSFEEIFERRYEFLIAYQDLDYAERYRSLILRMVEAEKAIGRNGLAEAAARGFFKRMAIKDEYEVARLYTDGGFAKAIAEQFEGDLQLTFHFAPPLLAQMGSDGRPRKIRYGGWMLGMLKILARMKGLRGSWLDPFRHSAERRLDHQLLAEYEALLEKIFARLSTENHAIAVDLALLAMEVRGFGPVKEETLAKTRARETELLKRFGG
jgi:indolepyruvate ferredoxin oxidoreductase